MLRKIRERTQSDETAFTLIEVLVITLIIGIMVAIALPAFLPRSAKSQDASARSDARNLANQVDGCYSDKQDYTKCTSPPNTGLSLGSKAGQVKVTRVTPGSYTIVAHSYSGNSFTLEKGRNGHLTRTCNTRGRASCSVAGTW